MHATILALVVGGSAAPAWGQTTEEVLEILQDRAQAHGASAATLIRIARCESTFRPWAVGDQGRSHGLVQLNDRPTGLLAHFLRQGYTSAYDAWSAADYLARVAVGEWAREGITLQRWTCARR